MKTKNKRAYQYIMVGVIFIAFLKPLFELSVLIGLGYIGAVAFSLYNRTLIKDPKMIAYIVGGSMLSYAPSFILPMIWEGIKTKEWFNLPILVIVYLLIFLKAYYLKKGKNITFRKAN